MGIRMKMVEVVRAWRLDRYSGVRLGLLSCVVRSVLFIEQEHGLDIDHCVRRIVYC